MNDIPRGVAESLDTATALLVGFSERDRNLLMNLLDSVAVPESSGCAWDVRARTDIDGAFRTLRQWPCQVLLCDQDRLPGAWNQLLDRLPHLSRPPSLIVASRLADERLWEEVLTLGAYDVLAKPFSAAEVVRVMRLACMDWQQHFAPRSSPSHVVPRA